MSDESGGPVDLDRRYEYFVGWAIRLVALALLVYAALLLIRPFIMVAIWSVVLTVALYPAYEWISLGLGGRRRLAAGAITGLNLLIVIGPASWLVSDLIESIGRISAQFDLASLRMPPPPASLNDWPVVGPRLYEFLHLASSNLTEAVERLVPLMKPLAGDLLATAASAGVGILIFLASIIVAGFLFAPAPALVATITSFARRLSPRRGEEFVHLAGATIRTVARGVIGISALQALLVGIGVAVAQIPGTSLLTSAVLILGIIQIGPSVVLIPLVIWVWFTMETTAAVVFTAYMTPIILMDNILRPLVMARGLKTPMLVILLGVIGGTISYGIIGVFLGPIILAVIWELLAAWMTDRETT